MLVDGDREAMEFRRAGYDDDLTELSRYVEGDLVSVASGEVLKSVITTPANILPLYIAGQDWDQPFALPYFEERGVPLNVIPQKNLFVMTYQGATANGTPHEFVTADLNAVRGGARREIVYNTVERCYTVRAGATNPTVQLVDVHKGAVGDTNVQVIVRILDPYLGS